MRTVKIARSTLMQDLAVHFDAINPAELVLDTGLSAHDLEVERHRRSVDHDRGRDHRTDQPPVSGMAALTAHAFSTDAGWTLASCLSTQS